MLLISCPHDFSLQQVLLHVTEWCLKKSLYSLFSAGHLLAFIPGWCSEEQSHTTAHHSSAGPQACLPCKLHCPTILLDHFPSPSSVTPFWILYCCSICNKPFPRLPDSTCSLCSLPSLPAMRFPFPQQCGYLLCPRSARGPAAGSFCSPHSQLASPSATHCSSE